MRSSGEIKSILQAKLEYYRQDVLKIRDKFNIPPEGFLSGTRDIVDLTKWGEEVFPYDASLSDALKSPFRKAVQGFMKSIATQSKWVHLIMNYIITNSLEVKQDDILRTIPYDGKIALIFDYDIKRDDLSKNYSKLKTKNNKSRLTEVRRFKDYKKVWELQQEGKSGPEIAKAMGYGTNYAQVADELKRFKAIMKRPI